MFPSHRKRTWIDHFCQRQTIGDEKSIYLARTLPRSHSEPKSGSAQFSQGPLGGKVMEGRDYWGARPPHPPYPGIQFGEKNISRWANLILPYPFYFARRQLVRCYIAHFNQTLPKAQRTRNLLGYSQVQIQIWIKLHLQNLDPAFTSKSQLNITNSTKLRIQNLDQT